jgi:hypothetical protein
MTQRKASFTAEEWAAIVARSGLPPTYINNAGEEKPTTESDYLRAALGLERAGRGGIRLGGFEPGNQHNPRVRKRGRKRSI